MSKQRCCYEVVFLDVSNKWLDDTKTTVELIYHDELGATTVLAYVHTNKTVGETEKDKDKYIDIMLKTIKENITHQMISYEEEEKEQKEFEEKYGHVLHYTSDRCKGCGRVRVELWSSGKKICEKCHINQDTLEYEPVRY